jgi:molecular chaperone GrpE
MSENENDKNNPEDVLEPEIIEENEAFDAEEEDVLDELITRLQTAEEESAKNLDGWQRAQAEFVNFRKRVERDQGRMYEEAAGRVIKRFLPAIDDFDRALQNRPVEGEAGEWANGMELIYRKLQTILESEGVTAMEVEGEMFDPNLHEAISQTESPEHESGQIIEVIQKGYMIGDRVLRAALVRVAS